MNTSKIIKGVVGGGRYTVTAPIIKEDYGLYLKIEGFDLPTSYEVDFSNDEHNGSSITMIGNADGVLIPSQFISSGKDVFAFLYHVGVDFGRTVYKFRIPNKLRPDRTDETPTPEEQSTIDQAISALNSAVEQTAQDVISADQSARSAESAKTAAESARDTAGEYANDAQSSAESASESARVASEKATASAQSASQSAQIKADVEDLVDDARSYAESALIASQASVTARDTAQGYALSASASAQSASGYASNAQTSANTASSKATEASTSAQTASAKATEAAQSASQALSYKTDAESAKTASQTAQGLAESARDTAVSAKTDAESARDDAETARDEAQSAVASISGALTEKAPVITDTASGSIASFSDGADGLPLKSLVIDINPVQDLHGQDSPYPAGGGKNLLKNNLASQKKNGITVSVDSQGIITLTGTATVQTQFDINTDIGIGAGNYILSGISDGSSTTLKLEAKVDGSWDVNLFNGERSLSVATGIEQLVIIVYNGASLSNVQIKPMIRLSTVTDATFAPYENICPISGWTEINAYNDPLHGGNIEWNQLCKCNTLSATLNGLTYTNNGDGSVSVSGTATVRTNISLDVLDDNYIVPHHVYALFGCPQGGSLTTFAFGIGGLGLEYGGGRIWTNQSYSRGNSMFTVYANQTVNFQNIYPQLFDLTQMFGAGNEPSTVEEFRALFPDDYYAYNEGEKTTVSAVNNKPYTHITINIGQTVYGGKLNVLSGELVIDRAMVDLGTLMWTSEDSYLQGMARAAVGVADLGAVYSQTPLCSTLKGTSPKSHWQVEMGTVCFSNSPSTPFIRVRSQIFSGLSNAEIKTALTGVQFVYELAEPIEIQLSANQFNSLYGQNNLWADSGDTTCEYRANTKLYIQKKIAEAIASLS